MLSLKTIYEARKNNLPFVINDGFQDFEITPIDDSLFVWRAPMDYEAANYVDESLVNLSDFAKWQFVDAFNDERTQHTSNGSCRCPIVSLLQQGCNCGSIQRYAA